MKKPKKTQFKPIPAMGLVEAHTYGLTAMRFESEETGEFFYRPILELAGSSGEEHCVLFAMNICDTNLRDACYEAVISAMAFCSDHYNEIAVFDEDGVLIPDDQPDFTVEDLLNDFFEDQDLIQPDDLSPDRKIH